jgi:nucleoside-diphosphate-sugar epimerase
MRVFVAGATGAIGQRLVPLLVDAGHEVVGSTRTPSKTDGLRVVGATPVVMDGHDGKAIRQAVLEARPDVVVHQMTSLSSELDLQRFAESFAETNRLRTESTDHLLAASVEAGARRFVAQSFAGWPNEQRGGPIKTEDDPVNSSPPGEVKETLEPSSISRQSPPAPSGSKAWPSDTVVSTAPARPSGRAEPCSML